MSATRYVCPECLGEVDFSGTESARRDLGRLFFAVTAATAGLLVGVGGLSPAAATAATLGLSLLLLLAALVIALLMALPPFFWKLTGELDLYRDYNRRVRNTVVLTAAWFLTWLIGVVLGLVAVL